VKAHAIVESFPAEFLEVGDRSGSGVVVESNDHLLEISFLADLDLHDRDLWAHGGGVSGGQGSDNNCECCEKDFHQETRGN
jgi:hypothetical protein